MAIEDRVAFACTFLSNSKLHDYLMSLTEVLVSEGDLAGMLLTGATVEAVPLLQHFLDHTGDLQSVSLIAVNTFNTSLLEKDSRVENWVNRSVTLVFVFFESIFCLEIYHTQWHLTRLKVKIICFRFKLSS